MQKGKPQSAEEELALFTRLKECRERAEAADNPQAAEKFRRQAKDITETLVEANLRLVLWAVSKYSAGSKLCEEELFQIGSLGLWRAIEKFDASRGARLSTYALWWIRQHLRRLEQEDRLVHVPTHVQDILSKIKRQFGGFEELASGGCDGKIAEALKINKSVVELARGALRFYELESLNAAIGEGSDYELVNVLVSDEPGPEDAFMQGDLLSRLLLPNLLSMLSERERLVVAGRFVEQKTLEEIGRVLGVTRERVRQIESKALRRLKLALLRARGGMVQNL